MTKATEHKGKAKEYIFKCMKNSEKSYPELMVDLENQIDVWRDKLRELSYINVFELTDEQYDKKNYLEALIIYSEKLIFSNKHEQFCGKSKVKLIREVYKRFGSNLSKNELDYYIFAIQKI